MKGKRWTKIHQSFLNKWNDICREDDVPSIADIRYDSLKAEYKELYLAQRGTFLSQQKKNGTKTVLVSRLMKAKSRKPVAKRHRLKMRVRKEIDLVGKFLAALNRLLWILGPTRTELEHKMVRVNRLLEQLEVELMAKQGIGLQNVNELDLQRYSNFILETEKRVDGLQRQVVDEAQSLDNPALEYVRTLNAARRKAGSR